MPIALTCECGARLEIDDKFAGKPIDCPDCQRPLPTGAPPTGRRITSSLALVSLLLALVGAFTLVGTIAAVFVGIAALIQISRRSEQLAGRRFAVAGIVLGVIMTAGTVFAISSIELFGLSGLLSESTWAGKLEYGGDLETIRPREGFAFKRLSDKWGVYRSSKKSDNIGGVWDDLLVVQPSADLTVLCYAVPVANTMRLQACNDKVLRDLQNMNKVGLFEGTAMSGMRSRPIVKKSASGEREKVPMIETQVEWSQMAEHRAFLIRVFKRDDDDRLFVVIGGTKRGHFDRLESQMREAMDGFRVLPQDVRGDR
jgi:Domain of unknown function (DUF4190)